MTPTLAKIIVDQCNRVLWLLKKNMYTVLHPLDARVAVSAEPVPFVDRLSQEYREVKIGEKWSERLFDCGWINITGSAENEGELFVALDIDGEGLLYNKAGCPVRGLTNTACTYDPSLGLPEKIYIPLDECEPIDGRLDFWVEAANNDLFGYLKSGTVQRCELVRRCAECAKLYYDYKFVFDLYCNVMGNTPLKNTLMYALRDANNLISSAMSKKDYASSDALLSPHLNRKSGAESLLTLYAEGHAHLDLAWLWPVRETHRKAARTFATALKNLEKYPFYRCGFSQPQQFKWVKEDHPELYKQIKKAIAGGRMEAQGGMWVEADTNLTGGEALIRQFLYGKAFFKEEFGKDIDILWLPDVFGFSGALPQIMRGCGVDKILTIKLSWSLINKFPYHSFVWKGIDGSEVLVHMPPEGNYNSSGTPRALLTARESYSESGLCDCAMVLYGVGDGGGGAGEEHLELIGRAENVYGLPQVVHATADEFFERLMTCKDKLPVFKGEMYLERHQGTYTSQAKNKRYNRMSENALMLLEALYCQSMTSKEKKFTKEDRAALDRLWQQALLYQFHDILPGSSIKRVYDESELGYEKMLKELDELSSKAVKNEQDGNSGTLSAFNNTGFERCEFVKKGTEWFFVSAQPFASGELKAAEYAPPRLYDDVIDNGLLRARFKDGKLISLFDLRTGRETLSGESNIFAVYNDVGDAWDIDMNYSKRTAGEFNCISSQPFTDGPIGGYDFCYEFGGSRIFLKAYLTAGSPLLKFEATADWREKDKMLRVNFSPSPVAESARFDIQFGSVSRSLTDNNSLEEAQFEVSAHKWVDVSEQLFGLCLINDCKYGFRAKNGLVSMNVLRSQNQPCVGQDIGFHSFGYALLSHEGGGFSPEIQKHAYCFNRPLKLLSCAPFKSLMSCSNPMVVIECIKPSEDGSAVVARIYNAASYGINPALTVGFNFKKAEYTDMLENPRCGCDLNKLCLKPFEVLTIKLTL